MKIIAIIISIITITFSALPCDDDVNLNDQQLTSISQSSNNDNGGIDLCSPFCICICCTGVVLEPTIQRDILISEIPAKELNTGYIASFTSNSLTLISQPPQV
ncbi:MAG: DUF6660 family protein [Lutibacter sp.]